MFTIFLCALVVWLIYVKCTMEWDIFQDTTENEVTAGTLAWLGVLSAVELFLFFGGWFPFYVLAVALSASIVWMRRLRTR